MIKKRSHLDYKFPPNPPTQPRQPKKTIKRYINEFICQLTTEMSITKEEKDIIRAIKDNEVIIIKHYDENDFTFYREVSEENPNPQYDKQVESYKKALIIYEKDLEAYTKDLAQWELWKRQIETVARQDERKKEKIQLAKLLRKYGKSSNSV